MNVTKPQENPARTFQGAKSFQGDIMAGVYAADFEASIPNRNPSEAKGGVTPFATTADGRLYRLLRHGQLGYSPE